MFLNEEALKLNNQLKDLNKELEIERQSVNKENDLNLLRRRILQNESDVSKDKMNELEQKIEKV